MANKIGYRAPRTIGCNAVSTKHADECNSVGSRTMATARMEQARDARNFQRATRVSVHWKLHNLTELRPLTAFRSDVRSGNPPRVAWLMRRHAARPPSTAAARAPEAPHPEDLRRCGKVVQQLVHLFLRSLGDVVQTYGHTICLAERFLQQTTRRLLAPLVQCSRPHWQARMRARCSQAADGGMQLQSERPGPKGPRLQGFMARAANGLAPPPLNGSNNGCMRKTTHATRGARPSTTRHARRTGCLEPNG